MISTWEYLPLSKAAEICDNLRKPINSKERNERIAGKSVSELFPYYGATGQVGYIDDYITDGEYVLLGEDGAPFLSAFAEKAYIINGKTWVNNHAHILKSHTSNKFLCYYLNSFNFKGYVSGTTRLKLTQASMKQIMVPVPPLEEQHRIVTRIEELFSQLDSGIETLKKTKEQLKVYRQAVLKEAFAHIDEYNIIRNMSSLVTSGSRGWAKYYSNSGAKFVRIGNLTRTGIDIDFKDTQFVELPDKAEGVRSKLLPNDVLVSITADLGSIALVPDNIDEAYINQHIALVRFNNPNQGKFMAYYLRSDYGQKELLKNKRGAGKLGLGLDDIRDSRVPIVTDDMASSVVAEIESRLSVCDSIEKTIDTALQEAEALRQSILKQAFEGGL
ncbi:MAG TPA: restriction endonuclease subunit S [Ruminococcus sp.]